MQNEASTTTNCDEVTPCTLKSKTIIPRMKILPSLILWTKGKVLALKGPTGMN